ncbi:hypothetical protein RUM44_007314 [Polyplax serrata]|uniref:Uncharacterized protein n=1 Tax=Polyplax serrata TaxID=468196 RepID=A0ABR1B0C6_POLSC
MGVWGEEEEEEEEKEEEGACVRKCKKKNKRGMSQPTTGGETQVEGAQVRKDALKTKHDQTRRRTTSGWQYKRQNKQIKGKLKKKK